MDDDDPRDEVTLSNIQGQVVDNFEILEQFSSGGFGRVHIARHVITDAYCAAKVIDVSQQTRETFTTTLREVSVFMQVSHPSLPRFFHLSQVSALLIFFMEFVPHGTLSAHVRQYDSGLPESEAQRLFRQIFSALRHCHVYHFLVHRDVKLENILLDAQMNVKLIDFGLSDTFYNNTMKKFVGTPGYAAPEVITGNDYDDRCDVWSLGVCLYKMAVGKSPFIAQRDSSRELVAEAEALNYPDRLTPQLVDLLRKMLAPLPSKRCTLIQLQSHPYLAGVSILIGNILPRPIVFYRANRFQDVLKFRRSPCVPDPAILRQCAQFPECDEATVTASLEEGRLSLAATVYFIMIDPLRQRPLFGTKLPPLPRSKRPPKPPGEAVGIKLTTIAGKPFALASNPILNKRPVIGPLKLQRTPSVTKYVV
jgi:serine/threonine protein kinase